MIKAKAPRSPNDMADRFPRIAEGTITSAEPPRWGSLMFAAARAGLFLVDVYSPEQWAALAASERPVDAYHEPVSGMRWRVRQ